MAEFTTVYSIQICLSNDKIFEYIKVSFVNFRINQFLYWNVIVDIYRKHSQSGQNSIELINFPENIQRRQFDISVNDHTLTASSPK